MKKHTALFLALFLMSTLFACATRTVTTNEMKAINAFSTEALRRSDYSVMGSIKGVGKITLGALGARGAFAGDTGKYGYLDESVSAATAASLNSSIESKDPAVIAQSNAIYDAIMQAQKMGADALWMPQFTTVVSDDKGHKVITCTVYAKAIKIKDDYELQKK